MCLCVVLWCWVFCGCAGVLLHLWGVGVGCCEEEGNIEKSEEEEEGRACCVYGYPRSRREGRMIESECGVDGVGV